MAIRWRLRLPVLKRACGASLRALSLVLAVACAASGWAWDSKSSKGNGSQGWSPGRVVHSAGQKISESVHKNADHLGQSIRERTDQVKGRFDAFSIELRLANPAAWDRSRRLAQASAGAVQDAPRKSAMVLLSELIAAAAQRDVLKARSMRDQIAALPKPVRGERKAAGIHNTRGIEYFAKQQYASAEAEFRQAAAPFPCLAPPRAGETPLALRAPCVSPASGLSRTSIRAVSPIIVSSALYSNFKEGSCVTYIGREGVGGVAL